MSVDLNSYHGYLEAEEIAEGMNAANRSARRLWKDAKILLKAERYPSAVALAILSIATLRAGKGRICMKKR
ncbi:AbiV family abortive infection protein [Salinibacter ruber]|uniref:AbiV family abortive infection protein n=1 Tax=Salinibacter ruber TaxID=146919 RepID=UPI0023430033|nr:hypothetical protein [Salinibacter ruber]